MWKIYQVRNTLLVSKDCAKALLKDEDICEDFGWEDVDDFWNKKDGRLYFNSDHNEHMDFLSYESVRRVLCKHGADGDVCFYSGEGDNENTAWGYRFVKEDDSKRSKCFRLHGTFTWKLNKALKVGGSYQEDEDESKCRSESEALYVCTSCQHQKFRTYDDETYPYGTWILYDEHYGEYCGDCGSEAYVEKIEDSKKKIKSSSKKKGSKK